MLRRYDMWNKIGLLNTGETMAMPMKPEFAGKPCHSAPYPISKHKQALLDPFLNALEKDGVIEDSFATNYSSPCLIVIQKGRPRFVVDYRKINARSVPDPYPLPRQDEVMNAVQGSTYITLLDLKKAFFQMPIAPEDRNKTTFVTPHRGAKQFSRALMGYLNSPAFCQRQMDKILGQYKWSFVVCYIDDIVIYSKTWEDHLRHVNWVLNAVNNVGITLDPAKAYLGFSSLRLLGHLVSRFGLSVQQEKVEAMRNLPIPKTLGDLDKALGFFGYYRSFIESYAQVVAPLTEKLKRINRKDSSHQSTPIEWNDDCQRAFDRLKEMMANTCQRAHSKWSPSSEYVLYVDACKIGFGGALHLLDHGKELPVIFISRALKANEKNYWPTKLELGGLVWSLSKLEPIVEGHPLKIFTDHSALTWLFSSTDSKSRCNQRLLL